ncbi:sigma factor-like helix-turn-helix DNA-binding protein [Alteromonas sp. AMM-1]|uniref:sigma factor-like helix-turn-helix DNA-binding protein n=1 Tax=Alteromonas sp. AMM-1 TaxID=3394233 RepID=UPI0039A744DD
MKGPQPPNPDIDIGLAALCKYAEYGQTLTHQEIADVCGCTRSFIYKIEQKALRKFRHLAAKRFLYEFLED